MPPDVIFYSETGGKSAPFYRTLGGIKSAFKTVGNYDGVPFPPKVYRGTVTWQELDIETGLPLYRTSAEAVPAHIRAFHPDLVTGHDPVEDHDRSHSVGTQDHVHGEPL